LRVFALLSGGTPLPHATFNFFLFLNLLPPPKLDDFFLCDRSHPSSGTSHLSFSFLWEILSVSFLFQIRAFFCAESPLVSKKFMPPLSHFPGANPPLKTALLFPIRTDAPPPPPGDRTHSKRLMPSPLLWGASSARGPSFSSSISPRPALRRSFFFDRWLPPLRFSSLFTDVFSPDYRSPWRRPPLLSSGSPLFLETDGLPTVRARLLSSTEQTFLPHRDLLLFFFCLRFKFGSQRSPSVYCRNGAFFSRRTEPLRSLVWFKKLRTPLEYGFFFLCLTFIFPSLSPIFSRDELGLYCCPLYLFPLLPFSRQNFLFGHRFPINRDLRHSRTGTPPLEAVPQGSARKSFLPPDSYHCRWFPGGRQRAFFLRAGSPPSSLQTLPSLPRHRSFFFPRGSS